MVDVFFIDEEADIRCDREFKAYSFQNRSQTRKKAVLVKDLDGTLREKVATAYENMAEEMLQYADALEAMEEKVIARSVAMLAKQATSNAKSIRSGSRRI